MVDIKRMWINQPSTSQEFHHMHGTKVLAIRESPVMMRVYFLDGDVISQHMPTKALSMGWPQHLFEWPGF
jgi:hypothetical protein